MKRLLLLLIPSLAFGMGRTPPARPAPTTATYDIGTGQLVAADYSGQSQSAAGNSRIADTGASGVATAFAGKSDPTMELAWFDINRAAEDQPDVAIDLALANEHKSAVENIRQLANSPNISVAALDFAKEGLKTVQAKIAAREREKAARGKADTSAFRATAYLQGPGAVSSVALMAGTMGAAVANGNEKRAQFTSDIDSKVVDTTNTNDWQGVSNVLRHQLELAKIDLEMAKIKAAGQKSSIPPVVKPTEPKPVDPVAPSVPVTGFSCTPKFDYAMGPFVRHTAEEATRREGANGLSFRHKTKLDDDELGRGRVAQFIPGDRPKIVAAEYRANSGQVVCPVIEYAPSESRQRLQYSEDFPAGPGKTVCLYEDGGTESFAVAEGRKSQANKGYEAYKKQAVEPVDSLPTTSGPPFILEPDRLTLRPDFAAVVRDVDALARNNEPQVNPIIIDAGKVGPHTWGIPKPLGSYPKSETGPAGQKALPNTWRISLVKGAKIPEDVTYHRSIMQTFIQDGATKTYPPTTRE